MINENENNQSENEKSEQEFSVEKIEVNNEEMPQSSYSPPEADDEVDDSATMFSMPSFMNTWKRRYRKLMGRRKSRSRSDFIKAQFTRAKLLRNVAILALGGLLFGSLMVLGLFAWFAKDLPQPDKIVRKEGFATKILDRNQELLYEVFADQQRTPVTLDQVPDALRKATIAIEDKNFYEHGGFDPKGIARAMFINVVRGRRVGGSTLTQQLVKNVLLTREKTLARKVKEFILAVQIESRYNKDEILQMYLNEAPYGGTAWGVATAAQTYYGKDVSELSTLESAILAGMPQRPSYYSPFSGERDAYKARTEHVLRRMREDGYISQDEETQYLEELKNHEFEQKLTSIKAPHFVLHVKDQLEEMYGQQLVEQGGLRVTTTLDYEIHEKAQEIVTEEIADVAEQGIGNGAAMVVDSKTGEVWSMVGSKDFFAEDYDGQVNVTQSLRQPGSAIKPVTYAAAFKKGYTPAHMLMDVKTEFPGSSPDNPYIPVNYDGTYRGPVQLRFALGSSLNVPAVKLLALVGLEDMLQTAYDMGFETLEPTSENMKRFGLSVTLGGGEVTLEDLTTAYGAFSNGGYKVEPVTILKVEDRDGKVLYEHKGVQGKRVLDEGVAFLMNHVLSDNNARLLTFGANSYLNMNGRPVAVKTGTTNDKRDNWTVGWSPDAVVGVWVGNNDNSPMKQVASGVTGASPIWRRIMIEVLNKYPSESWDIPSNVDAHLVDIISGYPEHNGFPARSEYAINGTLPSLPDPVHTMLKLCRGTDKLATDLDIRRNEFEEKEFIVPTEDVTLGSAPSWQKGIDEWMSSQGDSRYHPPTEYCDTASEVEVKVNDPKPESNYGGNDIKVSVRVYTQGEVEKVEIFVDGAKKETLVDRPYETTLNLKTGMHTLKVKATREDGKTGESGDIRIGVGGVEWNADEKKEEDKEPEATESASLLPPGLEKKFN